MLNKLMADLKEAMKSKNVPAKEAISLIVSKAKGYAKDGKVEATDEHIMKAVKSELKQTEEALALMEKNLTPEAKAAYETKIKVIKGYLPKQLSADEIKALVPEIATTMNKEKTQKNMGALIKEIKARVGDAADGKLISQIVKEYLNS